MRVLFAGTPDFAVPTLQALIQNHNVIGVYTQPDRASGRGKKITQSPVKRLALQHDLNVLQPQSLRDQESIIQQLNPDVFIVVAFGMLLPQSILDIPRLGCINVHGSILPLWRGAAPIQRAIEAGDKETGVSIMQMEAGLDTGPVFKILKTNISLSDSSLSLHDRLAQLGAQGVNETIAELEQRMNKGLAQLEPVAQDDKLASYAKKITKAEAQVDWQQSAEVIQCKIRAFNPWPICQTYHGDTRIRLWQSSIVKNISDSVSKPGKVLATDENGIVVACGQVGSTQDSLTLEVLQRDGSKPLTSKEFLNGYAIKVGDVLS
ncbi:MAG: methionyl-tRNA formyltransferase [Acidiferrobacterales bacterium]|nr:methionyl-tRNA formyltransferase [Acidiferrobacterales bacterium]